MTLPYVDEHATEIAAGADEVWHALVSTIGGATSGRAATVYARAVGCTDLACAGPRPLAEGSTFPGFHVVGSAAGSELALAGRHRFSTYELTFHLDEIGAERTRLRAETRAEFPGALGGAYRLMVIRSGAHRVLTRRLLAGIRRRCE